MALTSEFSNCCVIKAESESAPRVVNQLCHLVKGLVPIANQRFLLPSVALRHFEGDAVMLLHLMDKHLKYGL